MAPILANPPKPKTPPKNDIPAAPNPPINAKPPNWAPIPPPNKVIFPISS